jgi:hypothetical protein
MTKIRDKIKRDRAEARVALGIFETIPGSDTGESLTNIIDLITSLLHLADEHVVDHGDRPGRGARYALRAATLAYEYEADPAHADQEVVHR